MVSERLGITIETPKTGTVQQKYKYFGLQSVARPTFPLKPNPRCLRPAAPSPPKLKLYPAKSVSFHLHSMLPSDELTCRYTEKQRRGPKGYFQGSRKEFLESQLPVYGALTKGARKDFWHNLLASWWQRYPWRLEDDEEPPTGNTDEMASLAEVIPSEEDQKKLVEQKLTVVRCNF